MKDTSIMMKSDFTNIVTPENTLLMKVKVQVQTSLTLTANTLIFSNTINTTNCHYSSSDFISSDNTSDIEEDHQEVQVKHDQV